MKPLDRFSLAVIVAAFAYFTIRIAIG